MPAAPNHFFLVLRYFLLLIASGGFAGLAGYLPAAFAADCGGLSDIRLTAPVVFSPQELAEFRAMPPLRVQAISAPPLVGYDDTQKAYAGVGIDVLCFITGELGLNYEILPERNLTAADKVLQVQQGRADLFLPLSLTPERSARGIYTLPYYESYYAVIARKGRRVTVRDLEDLAAYRVGVFEGAVFESILRETVPNLRLVTYDLDDGDDLLQALQDGDLDVAVFNRDVFIEKRYQHEYFSLEVVRILREYPRAYRFYLSPTPAHRRLAQAFDRYLAVMDVSGSVAAHEDAERQFLERYVAQRSYRILLQVASVLAVLLALGFYLGLRRYRRLMHLLAERNREGERQQRALQAAYQELEKQSQTDGLTKLFNRHHFDRVLVREYDRQRRTRSPLSLLLIDIDHFKYVNDHYGHLTGDDYLRAVSRSLESSITRATDLVARFGGEEFACILPDTAADDALLLASKAAKNIEDLRLPNALSTRPHLTVSIGVATLLNSQASLEEFLGQADTQLYAAKQAGRNCVRRAILDEQGPADHPEPS